MKSIKEMSDEYLEEEKDEIVCVYDRYAGFVDGANYVLDEVGSLMKDVSDEFPRFQQGTIIHGRLIKLLEQLKK